MQTQGVEEHRLPSGSPQWIVRSECRACRWQVGAEGTPESVASLVDRLIWSDDASHVLERMPPYMGGPYQRDVEAYAESTGRCVVTWDLLVQVKQGGEVQWEGEATHRLENIPGPIRTMAKVELERTAAARGLSTVTPALMDEVRARYFGMGEKKS